MNKNMEMMKKLIEEKRIKGRILNLMLELKKLLALLKGEERATMVEDYLINNI